MTASTNQSPMCALGALLTVLAWSACVPLSISLADTIGDPAKERPRKVTGLPKRAGVPQGPMFAFQGNGLWGLMDSAGNVIYKPQFDNQPKFHDGVAQVSYGRLMWITKDGKTIVPEKKVASARGFSEGLAPVNIGMQIHMGDILKSAGLWGFMDLNGKIAIKPKFTQATGFSNGLAAVAATEAQGKPKGGLIAIEGAQPRGRAKWGYIDRKGDWAIKPQFLAAGSFSDGLAFVGMTVPGQRFVKQGCIDTKGNQVIAPLFEQPSMFIEGCAAVRKDGKWGYIDKTGQPLTKFEFDSAGPMRGGMALVWKWDKNAKGQIVKSRCGFLNSKGKPITELKYESAYDPADGMAPVQVAGKWGFVDATGKLAIKPQFTSPGSFSEGLAAVQIGGKYGYINKNGQTAVRPQFQFAHPFSNGLARVVVKKVIKGEDVVSTEFAYVTKEGKVVSTWKTGPPRRPSW